MIQGMHSDVASMKKACIWREASRIISEEGFQAFWKGNLVTIAHRLPYSSISIYAFERYKNLLQLILGVQSPGKNISADLCIRLVGGDLAGITATSATYPLDLVRTRLAAQTNVMYYRGIGHALRTISREEGVFGLYKELRATLLWVHNFCRELYLRSRAWMSFFLILTKARLLLSSFLPNLGLLVQSILAFLCYGILKIYEFWSLHHFKTWVYWL